MYVQMAGMAGTLATSYKASSGSFVGELAKKHIIQNVWGRVVLFLFHSQVEDTLGKVVMRIKLCGRQRPHSQPNANTVI